MLVLNADGPVKVLRFAPDSRRLLAGTTRRRAEDGRVDQQGVLNIWSLIDGTNRCLPMPTPWGWQGECQFAFPAGGEQVEVTHGESLYVVPLDRGDLTPVPGVGEVHYVYRSPAGDRQLLLNTSANSSPWMIYARSHGRLLWEAELGGHMPAGFLPDGDRFVSVEPNRVYVRSFVDGGQNVTVDRYRFLCNRAYPQLSPDGRYLGTAGFSNLYVCDLARPGEVKKITASTNNGDFQSFAFHPTNGTLAVIHGGPTLVNLYDVATLKPLRKFNWKLGPLWCVAFSPDGALAAAGSEDGRIVVWDVDE